MKEAFDIIRAIIDIVGLAGGITWVFSVATKRKQDRLNLTKSELEVKAKEREAKVLGIDLEKADRQGRAELEEKYGMAMLWSQVLAYEENKKLKEQLQDTWAKYEDSIEQTNKCKKRLAEYELKQAE